MASLAQRVADLATAIAADVKALSAPTWQALVMRWDTPPVNVGAVSGGAVLAYALEGVTRYRLVPAPYVASQDAFYAAFEGGVLSDLICARG
jgi:hypothetical protein